MLGLVLFHVSCDKMNDKERELNEIQLSRTIFAMIKASRDLESPDNDQIAFCYWYLPYSSSHLALGTEYWPVLS